MNDQTPVETRSSESDLLDLCTEIVSAYVSNNAVSQTDLGRLITEVHGTLSGLSQQQQRSAAAETRKPAVPVRKSVTPDYIVCLEDGKQFKSLKRHLATHYNLTPGEYREKWNLPPDYPMVAPNYAAARSALAKKMGLGRKRRK